MIGPALVTCGAVTVGMQGYLLMVDITVGQETDNEVSWWAIFRISAR